MGLAKEVRDFFKNKIEKVLEQKRLKIISGIDMKGLEAHAINLFSVDIGEPNILTIWEKLVKNQKEIEEKQERLVQVLNDYNIKINNSRYSRIYNSDFAETVKRFALNRYRDELLKETYPSETLELEKLDKVKEDVEGVILLATTEQKLVATLTKVLEKYGGEIKELLDFIPQG